MVDAVVTQALTAYRDYVTDGVPSSGPNDPAKADIRALWTMLGALIDSAGIAGFATLAAMNADLNYPANTIGQVFSDPTPANDGTYLKSGASGAGSWVQYSTLTLAGLSAAITTLNAEVATIQGGTLTGSQTQNKVLASPNGSSGAMTARALVVADLPAGIGGGLTFLGLWNASTNSPALASSVGTNGTFYIVSTAGTTTLNGVSSWSVGDEAVFAGGVWGRVPAVTPSVLSFNTRTGAVTLVPGDVTPAFLTNLTVASLAALQALTPSAGAVADLSLGGRSGRFAWSSANLQTQVANDPGQGVYVAPPGTLITTATVGGTISPSGLKTGTYSLGGTFNSAPYYASGGGFIWFFPGGPFWVLSVTLGDAVNCFAIGSGASLPPSGSYTPNGTVTGTAIVTVTSVSNSGSTGAWVRQYSGPADLGWWGSAGDGQLAFATGVLSFPTTPSNGQTFTVTPSFTSPSTVTFVTSGASGGYQLNIIPANPAANVAALLALLKANNDGVLSQVTYAAGSSSTNINVVSKTPGPAVGAFQAANYSCSTTITGATVPSVLSGGTCPGTDNGPAMAAFSTWARYQGTILGKAVDLTCAPGLYLFSLSTAANFLTGMPQFHFKAYGTTWQNIEAYPSIEPWPTALFGFSNRTNYLIQSTNRRDQQVKCITDAQAANMIPGIYYAVMSSDMQPGAAGSFPPNCFQLDYVKCTFSDPTTGIVKLDRPLRWAHLSTSPDLINNPVCGAARIWPIDQGFYGIYGTWDIEHIYEGMTVNRSLASGSTNYQAFTGRSVRTINWGGVGPSETVAGNVTHINPNFAYAGEPDKLVGSTSYYDMESTSGMSFQSSSPDRLMMKNCKVSGGVITGSKIVDIENCDLDSFSPGGYTLGLGVSCSVRNSLISSYSSSKNFFSPLAIDGTNVSYSNGTLKILASSGLFGIPWHAVVGQQLYFAGPSGIFIGDAGLGYVESLTTDGSNNLYINTTLPYATVPSWATGVYLIAGYATRVENSHGCDAIQQASWATANGKKEWEVLHYVLDGNTLGTGGGVGGYNADLSVVGQGISITIDVKIAAASDPGMFWYWYGIVAAALPFTAPATPLQLNINTAIAGKRVLTQAGITGAQSGDSFALGGSAITALPALFFSGPSSAISIGTLASLTPRQSPLIEFTMLTDTGLFRQLNMETV